MRSFAVAGVLFAAIVSSASAAEVGKAIVNGKEVILYVDGTWKPAEPSSSIALPVECDEVRSKKIPVSICLPGDKWTVMDAGLPFEYLYQLKKQDIYAGFITEGIHLPNSVLKKAILANINKVATLGSVKVLHEENILLGQQVWGTLEIVASIERVPFFYKFIYGSRENVGTVQLLVYGGSDYADAVRTVSRDILLRFD
jgi:hypothetical protein